MTQPIVSFLRSIPVPALVPAAAIAIGLNDRMRISVIAFGCI